MFSIFHILLRILGGNNLGMTYNQPKVTMSLFQEKDIPQSNDYKDGACRIENGQERTFSVNRGNNACVAHFHSVMLKNVKRPDKGKNEELVTEHKYAFVFYTVVNILNETHKLKVNGIHFYFDHRHRHRSTSATSASHNKAWNVRRPC